MKTKSSGRSRVIARPSDLCSRQLSTNKFDPAVSRAVPSSVLVGRSGGVLAKVQGQTVIRPPLGRFKLQLFAKIDNPGPWRINAPAAYPAPRYFSRKAME